MHLVEILLPLADNDGHPFDRALYEAVADEFTARFGGVTAFARAPATGLWRTGSGVKQDEIVVIEVMAPALDRDWWDACRRDLERRFRQDHVVVRAHRIELI